MSTKIFDVFIFCFFHVFFFLLKVSNQYASSWNSKYIYINYTVLSPGAFHREIWYIIIIIFFLKTSLQSSAVHTHTDTHAAISIFNFPLSQSYISYKNVSQNVAVNVTVLCNQNVQRCSNNVPISMWNLTGEDLQALQYFSVYHVLSQLLFQS